MWISRHSRDPLRLSWWIALPAAALGGWLLDASQPGLDFAWLTLPGIALLLAAWWQQRFTVGLLAGAVGGAAFWMPHIHWLTLYLGPIPWLALSAAMILWSTLLGGAIALATRGFASVLRFRRGEVQLSPGARMVVQATAAASLWVAKEQVQVSWPYGGFAWGRVAHSVTGTPYEDLVSWIGFAGLSGMTVFVTALMLAAMWPSLSDRNVSPTQTGLPRYRWMGAAAVALLLAVLVWVPRASLPETGTLTVAAVQGNSQSGIFDDRESGAVFQDHVDATEQLLDDLEATGSSVDVIVWPENSAEFGLPTEAGRSAMIARLAARANAPVVVGTIIRENTAEVPDGRYTNSALVWDDSGATGARYDKRYPVPFAEYMPHREFYGSLVPDLVNLVQLEYAFGDRPTVLDIKTPAGWVAAGIAICFDIVIDQQIQAMVDEGAEIILAPTNNADFGNTDQSAQQLEIARLRAIESGRSLVNISTVGTSSIVLPSGKSVDTLTPFTRESMVATVPLVEGVTPAIRWGAVIAGGGITAGVVLGIAGGGMLFGAYLLPRRLRSS